MYLKFYLSEEGKRVYTLKKHDTTGVLTQSAHPAKFSPEDQFSKYRLITKKRFELLPNQTKKTLY
uniref:Nucleolar protein 10 n=1 Tax=Rhabditophanes sp. KR3021 TaxID=114890 RepID=A0AC35U3R0_9BILA